MGASMTVRGSRRGARDDRGAVAVEFALVLPVLIVLVFGVIDFGRLFFAQITVTQAAREGSRLVALEQANASSRAQGAATGLNSPPPVVAIVQNCVGKTFTTDAEVTVKYTVTFSTPLAGLAGLPASKVVTGRGHMPCHG